MFKNLLCLLSLISSLTPISLASQGNEDERQELSYKRKEVEMLSKDSFTHLSTDTSIQSVDEYGFIPPDEAKEKNIKWAKSPPRGILLSTLKSETLLSKFNEEQKFAFNAEAFLFDVDGVLVASHELQATALCQAMGAIAHKYDLEFHPPKELNTMVLRMLIGGTDETVINKTIETFPVFRKHHIELFQNGWERYYQLVIKADNFKINESINLLKLLREIGYKICLVTNLKRKDIEHYCKILNLEDIIQANAYVCFEDMNGQAKPSPFPYLTAAKKLQVAPSRCIVFEDSENGVISAKRADMYAVGLHRYPFPEALSANGADEVVTNIFQAKILAQNMYSSADSSLQYNNTITRIVTMQALDVDEQESIAHATYQIYKTLFSGHSPATWRKKLIDEKDKLTRVGLFYANNTLGGYGVLKFREISFNNEERIVSLGSIGLLDGFRGDNLLFQYYQMEFRRILVACPNKTNHMIDNFLSYGGYKLALSIFNTLYPSIENPNVDPELFEYIKFLAHYINYTKANVDNPFIYLTTSSVSLSQAKEKISNGPNWKYFLDQTKLIKGHGLLAIAPVTITNLRPIDQFSSINQANQNKVQDIISQENRTLSAKL